jgi:hypothetical protein
MPTRPAVPWAASDPYLKGVPAGTTARETDYLGQAVVDSTQETGG